MRRATMLMAALCGLAPWFMPWLSMYARPDLGWQEAWRISGAMTMCIWTPSCLLVGLIACALAQRETDAGVEAKRAIAKASRLAANTTTQDPHP